MISKFTIENFMSIKSPQTISFEPTSDVLMSDEYTIKVNDNVRLLKIGVIYGSNASGKSNILQAFKFFSNLVFSKLQDLNEETGVVPFMLDEVSRNNTTKMSLEFYIESTKYILSYELDKVRIYSEKLIVYESSRPTTLYSRTYNENTDSSAIDFSDKLNMRKRDQDTILGNTMNNRSVIAAFSRSNVEKTKLNDVYDYFTQQFNDVLTPTTRLLSYVTRHIDRDESGKLKAFILKILKASDFNIKDIVLNKEEETLSPTMEKYIQMSTIPDEVKKEVLKEGKIQKLDLSFSHKVGLSTYKLPEEYESLGTIRFMGMATILYFLLYKNKFFPIDEVESSLHRELISYFIRLFLVNSKRTSQLLLTTHNTTLLDEDFIRRDIIWFADKDELGETHIVRLSSFGLHKNVSPYNAYMQEKLVKLPFLSSIYLNLDLNENNE